MGVSVVVIVVSHTWALIWRYCRPCPYLDACGPCASQLPQHNTMLFSFSPYTFPCITRKDPRLIYGKCCAKFVLLRILFGYDLTTSLVAFPSFLTTTEVEEDVACILWLARLFGSSMKATEKRPIKRSSSSGDAFTDGWYFRLTNDFGVVTNDLVVPFDP